VTLFEIAQSFVGKVTERSGGAHHPCILWAHELTTLRATADEISWCSSIVNLWCYLASIERSNSAAARSWLKQGEAIALTRARAENDIIVFNRAGGPMDPTVLDAPGHVAVFEGFDGDFVRVIGGNQHDAVTRARFPIAHVLGVRRLERAA
jgi:uncharacterized protein (TIGR02594 family)